MHSNSKVVDVKYLLAEDWNSDHHMQNPVGWENVNLSELFLGLTDNLSRHIEINRGVLILRRPDTGRLAAYTIWNNGQSRDGLRINLPEATSLFEKVAEDGLVYSENFCDLFSGNFFERKLLLDDYSQSFVVVPLKSEGEVVGLIAYSSEQTTAFTVVENGCLDGIAGRFGTVIEKKLASR
jgi:transcriptional regulator with GAF, ATPase, and Fis domain